MYYAKVSFDEQSAGYEISFRDFHNLHSVAYEKEKIELEAASGLTAVIGDLIDRRVPIPEPTQQQACEVLIHLPVLVSLKAALHNAMISTGTRKADLARKLNQKAPQIDRLLDVGHNSKVDQLEQALYLMGYEVSVSVVKL